MISLILRLFYIFTNLVEALISIRFILLMLNANKHNYLVSTVYKYSEPLVAPFTGVITMNINLFGLNFDVNSLVALFFFMILGYILISLIKAFSVD
ncbi:YggT family protein [Candidatus Dojkabacteria bacterium]|nr:YggT family protein [Candidatus Dojkabacteria bacterium]